MLSICRGSATKIPQFFGSASINVNKITPLRSYANIVCRRQFLGHNHLKAFQRGSGTVTPRLASDSLQKGNTAVGYWLLTCSGMVFVAVVLGGAVRRIDSEFSMWKFLGKKRPRTQQQWKNEFLKYQELPEVKYKDRQLTLSEFKLIWQMECMNKNWSKLTGAVFLIPAVYFWSKGKLPTPLKKRLMAFGPLLGLQSFLDWKMAKSRLKDYSNDPDNIPRVSQYTLAGQLGLTYFLHTLFLWSGLYQLWPAETVKIDSSAVLTASRKFRKLALISKAAVFLTAVSGAFVVALDAGMIYNSFPKMADKWIPDDIMAHSPKSSNITKNPTTVQFSHRVLGTTTLAYITGLWLLSRKRVLPRRAYLAVSTLAVVAYIQVALGITNLLIYLPTSTAVGHQSGSLLLLSTAIWLSHELRRLPKKI